MSMASAAKNHWNALKICLLGQTTKQLFSNFSPKNLENTSNFHGFHVI